MGSKGQRLSRPYKKKLAKSYWGYLMISCDRLRYIFNEYTLEQYPLHLVALKKRKFSS